MILYFQYSEALMQLKKLTEKTFSPCRLQDLNYHPGNQISTSTSTDKAKRDIPFSLANLGCIFTISGNYNVFDGQRILPLRSFCAISHTSAFLT